MNRKIDMKDATQPQLRGFANNVLGLNLPPNTKDETVVAKISAAWDKDFIMVPNEPAETAQVGDKPVPVTEAQANPEPKMVRIHITISEEPGGDEPVSAAVNGKAMRIPRGEDVDVPYPYFEVLKNAIAYKYDQLPEGGLNPVPREVPAYPFQRVA